MSLLKRSIYCCLNKHWDVSVYATFSKSKSFTNVKKKEQGKVKRQTTSENQCRQTDEKLYPAVEGGVVHRRYHGNKITDEFSVNVND